MLLRLIRFFRGYVTFKIIGRFPERFINLALKNGIGIFDALPCDGVLTASTVLSDYRVIRPIARRANVRLKITNRRGLPFVLAKFKNRWGIAVGIALFLVLSLVLQSFVWTVEINGVKTLSEAEIRRDLQHFGVTSGKFKGSLDSKSIERELLLKYDKIGWMTINIIGTGAQVEIKEKAVPPENEYSSEYSNLIASCDGIILSSNIRRGTSKVKIGSAVSKGQLLAEGVYENALGELSFTDADGDVFADTRRSFTASCDEAVVFSKPAYQADRTGASLLWFDFPLILCPENPQFSSYTESRCLYLNDNPVPLLIRIQRMFTYEPCRVELDKDKAKDRLNARLMLFKLFALKDALSVTEKTELTKANGVYTLRAEINCTESIAIKEKFIVNGE